MKWSFLFLLFLGCSHSSSWVVNSITSGDLAFDFTRARFLSLTAHPILSFEIVRGKEESEAFISLNRFRFQKDPVLVELIIDDEIFCDEVHVHEGAMRLKLSSKLSERIIQALQKGKEVAILVDGFREVLTPASRGELSNF
jgi:hypothetical protein